MFQKSIRKKTISKTIRKAKRMEVFQPLVDFYDRIEDDARICTTHISIYMFLLKQWNKQHCQNPIKVKREVLMKQAKISARQTYTMRMKQLHQYGYIQYFPSSKPYEGSTIYLNVLGK